MPFRGASSTSAGNRIESAYFGIAGEPVFRNNGYGIWRSKFDERGNRIETAYFGIDGEPVFHNNGIATWRSKYDERGNRIESAYFGIDGELVNGDVAYVRMSYNERNRLIEKTQHDAAGNLLAHRKSGRAVNRYEYDQNGRLLRECNFDAALRPVGMKGEGEWACRVRVYDDEGRAIEDQLLDTSDTVVGIRAIENGGE